jgi:hypothetical protein
MVSKCFFGARWYYIASQHEIDLLMVGLVRVRCGHMIDEILSPEKALILCREIEEKYPLATDKIIITKVS